MGKTRLDARQIQQITSATIANLIAAGVISATYLTTNATDAELNFLSGVTSSIQNQLNAKLAASVLKASTDAPDWTSDLIAVTAKSIAAKITTEVTAAQIGGVMVFRPSSWSQLLATPETIKAGYVYMYDSGTPPGSLLLESGDMLVAKTDAADVSDSADWQITQANISGAVTSIETATADGQLVLFNGTTGKSVKKATLTGLLKAVNGVLSAATASDLPTHTHSVTLKKSGVNMGTIIDVLTLSLTGPVTWSYNDTTKELSIGISPTYPTFSNGTVQSGKYIAGISISNGVITVTYNDLPGDVLQSKLVYGEVLTGTRNGVNKAFTYTYTAVTGTIRVYLNGMRLALTNDYTITTGTKTITLSADVLAPTTDDVLIVDYLKS